MSRCHLKRITHSALYGLKKKKYPSESWKNQLVFQEIFTWNRLEIEQFR